jgi:hypothetical protein
LFPPYGVCFSSPPATIYTRIYPRYTVFSFTSTHFAPLGWSPLLLPYFFSPSLFFSLSQKQCLPNYFCRFAWDLSQGLLRVGTFIRVTRNPCNQPYQSLYLKFSSHYTSYNTS